MQKLLYIFLIVVSNTLLAKGDNDDGPINITVNSQSEVNRIPKNKEIGNLIIASEGLDQITNLKKLAFIRNIQGNLYIINNKELSSLDGLADIEVSGDIYIVGNKMLDSIPRNAFMGNIRDIVVKRNAKLRIMKGFEMVKSVRNLTVEHNDTLFNLSHIVRLDEVSGYIRIVGNKSLESIKSLNDLSDFEGKLVVNDNVSLCDANTLYKLYTASSEFEISNNSIFTSDPEKIKLAYEGKGDLKLFTQEEIDAFGKSFINPEFIGDILIDRSNAKNLDGFKYVKSIKGRMTIKRNDSLVSIEGLSSLQSIDRLLISFNKNLESLKGLEKLRDVKTDLVIYRNVELKDASSISARVNVGGKLVVKGNPRLVE